MSCAQGREGTEAWPLPTLPQPQDLICEELLRARSAWLLHSEPKVGEKTEPALHMQGQALRTVFNTLQETQALDGKL